MRRIKCDMEGKGVVAITASTALIWRMELLPRQIKFYWESLYVNSGTDAPKSANPIYLVQL